MSDREVLRRRQKLDALFEKVSSAAGGDAEMIAQWARYLCILTAGFVETSMRRIYGEYTRQKASPEVYRFVTKRLKPVRNLNMEALCQLAGQFDEKWEAKLREVDEELKDAVDSIVANRNRIAHGEDVGIGYVAVKDYYDRVKKLVGQIEQQCHQ